MISNEIDNKRVVDLSKNNEIVKLEKWFKTDYIYRLNTINRYVYLGLTPPETRYDLEKLAYAKENKLRELKGLSPLPKLNIVKII